MVRPGIQKHLDIASLLQCPLCHEHLHAITCSLRCARGHDFAISSKGFLNLIPQQGPLKGYDEAFFTSRQRIMEAKVYRILNEALIQTLENLDLPDDPIIIDAGCGEGSYLKAISSRFCGTCIGIDIVKDAIRCAARGGGAERWLVADLANMPIRNHSVDVVLNVFTPANYTEFQRILKHDGMLVKVIPGPDHMHELRDLACDRLAHSAMQDHGVAEHLSRHMELTTRARVTQTSYVSPELARDLVRMSPVTFGMDPDELELDKLTNITVDAEVLCARPHGQETR